MGAKKKGKKSAGGRKGKNNREMLPNLYEIPEVPSNPSQNYPKVTLNFKLVNPVGFPMDFSVTVPTNTRIMTLQDKIAAMHRGGARDISISFHKHKPDAPAPPTATLIDMGILASGEVAAFYDFTAISYPLLS